MGFAGFGVLVHVFARKYRAKHRSPNMCEQVKMISVDLSDFAEFISIVQNRRILLLWAKGVWLSNVESSGILHSLLLAWLSVSSAHSVGGLG